MTFDVHGFEVEEEERPQGHDPREDSKNLKDLKDLRSWLGEVQVAVGKG